MDIEQLKLELLEPDLDRFARALDDADLSEQDRFGNTVLHYYLKHVKDLPFAPADMIDLLVAHGIDVDTRQGRGPFGYSPLHLAVVSDLREAFDALLARGAAVDQQDGHGNTPLMLAVTHYKKNEDDYSHFIRALLARGADAGRTSDSGTSPRELAHTIANSDVRKFFPPEA